MCICILKKDYYTEKLTYFRNCINYIPFLKEIN